MGFDSIWHWLILLLIVLVIFGTSKLTKIGPDLGNAMREFKKALHGGRDEDETESSDEEKLKPDPPDGTVAGTHESKPHETDESK